jgi:hypothetical protein
MIFQYYYKLFEYISILFGLYNISNIFQYYINNIFYKFLDKFLIIYLNNILIFFDILKEYKKYI